MNKIDEEETKSVQKEKEQQVIVEEAKVSAEEERHELDFLSKSTEKLHKFNESESFGTNNEKKRSFEKYFEAGEFIPAGAGAGARTSESATKEPIEFEYRDQCPFLDKNKFVGRNIDCGGDNFDNDSNKPETGKSQQELFIPKFGNLRNLSSQMFGRYRGVSKFERDGGRNNRGRFDTRNSSRYDAGDYVQEGPSSNQSRSNRYQQDLKKSQSQEYGLNNILSSGKRTEQQIYNILSEDMRISKILRRLRGEKNSNSACDLCKKLEIAVSDPANTFYIQKAISFLLESCIDILRNGPRECLSHLAKCFGIMGYVARNDFPIYKTTIFKNYDNCREIRCFLMSSLKITFHLDSKTLELVTYSERVLIQLKEYLENSDKADQFIAVSGCIGQFALTYKKSFEKHFTDIVDIIIGWHLETEQTEKLKYHCAHVLQNFSEFFIRKLDFTLGLLDQFLEDIQVFGEDIESGNINQKPEISVGSFIGALNSVLKCLSTERELIAFKLGQQIFTDATQTITKVGRLALRQTDNQETIQSINEYFTLIITYGQILIKYDLNRIIELIEIQENNLQKFTETGILSVLWLILTIVREHKTTIPIELIDFCLNPERSKFVCFKLINAENKIYRLYLKIFHEMLLIKNVPLLQAAYKFILLDLRKIKKYIFIKDSEIEQNYAFTKEQAECILNFYLSALSILATQTSSIIAMYALQPSILELLLKDLEATNLKLWQTSPSLHVSILNLLLVHCVRNHNFLQSSNLITTNVFNKLSLDDTSSPYSENFTQILNFHFELLQNSVNFELDTKCFNSILEWLNSIFEQTAEHSEALSTNRIFQEICTNLCRIDSHHRESIILKTAICMETLVVKYPKMPIRIFELISQVSKVHICSSNEKVRQKFTDLLSKMPLKLVLHSTITVKSTYWNHICDLQQWYFSTLTSTPRCSFREKYFKDFIDKLSEQENSVFIDQFIVDIFLKSWISISETKPKFQEFYRWTINNLTLLFFWAQLETAQYSIAMKLKTPLGKPQETFLKIESVVKKIARILALKDDAKCSNISALMANQKHAKLLLGFLDFLEKCIYNASEGAAFAIKQPEKPAKIFFRVNISTCNEWFNRIRPAVNLVGLHLGESELVIRYSEQITLQHQKNDALIEHTLISFVWALIKRKEFETLHGLYHWLKNVTGKRYTWIKCAAEHAAGSREKAAEGYIQTLKVIQNDDKHFREFIVDQLIECLFATHQLNELQEYILESRETMQLIALNQFHLNDLIKFSEEPSVEVLNLGNWDVINEEQDNLNDYLSYYKIISKTENTLVRELLQPTKKGQISKEIILCKEIIKSGLEEALRTGSKDHYNDFVILNHMAQLISEEKNLPFQVDLNKTNDSLVLGKCKKWADYFKAANRLIDSNLYNELHLNLISVARKETNLKLCQLELEKYFRNSKFAEKKALTEIVRSIQENPDYLNVCSESEIKGLFETSKWLFSQQHTQESGIQLAANCCIKIIQSRNAGDLISPEILDRSARMILNLSEWVQQHSNSILSPSHHDQTPMKRLVAFIPEIMTYSDQNTTNVIYENDMIVGKLIQFSVKQSPNLAKAWASLGNWYYKWGRKIIEAKSDVNAGLLPKDIDCIKNFLPHSNDEDIRQIVQILNQHQLMVDDEDNVGGQNEQNSTDLIASQLRNIDIIRTVPNEIVSSIIEIWRQAHKSVYSYYEMAADAYFKYLNLATSKKTDENCSVVTATLRLLRLVVKHAFGLKDVLESGLTMAPTHPWKAIIPQLFSRLNHHELYVRKRVSELLCRVAKDSPNLIIFPAVVGAVQNDGEEANPLTFCFNSLVDTLSKQSPETVQQVQVLVSELKRISLLWDEYWVHSLAHLYTEYSDLFNTHESEVRKCSSEEEIPLIKEKYKIIIDHVGQDLKHYQNHTSRPAETNYERMFQEKYSKLIESTIQGLMNKPLNLEKPNENWQKIKQIYSIFQQKNQKNFQNSLKMSDISPILAELKNTQIPMPGVQSAKPVYISHVDNTIYILPTKTKPKKLAFYGTDGRKYTYLFKGLEDLHLDERIMQFLSISNSMMAKSNDSSETIFRAHNYSVIPLGTQSGLITWVDGMTPLFTLYKKWQQRESTNPSPANIKKDKLATPMRPSEMFYKKLTPLLTELNMKIIDSRKTWPIATLRKVLEELTLETPKDLLSKELWCQSSNAVSWRKSILTYSRSVAVMSVIGYIIGLGDRHLDNILINLTNGNILHIDYNVCFEKGKTLRVPERVPFRMTQNLQFALGITGIEGTFRLTCEHVLKTLRKEREILLTLLEAFVYDPLVDWAVSDDETGTVGSGGNGARTKAALAGFNVRELAKTVAPDSAIENDGDGGGSTTCSSVERKQSRKKYDNEVMRNSLTSRFAEIKPAWTQYRNSLQEQLTQITNSINELESIRIKIQENENNRDYLSNQFAMIRELESLGSAMGSHKLNTVSQRYVTYKKSLDELNGIKKIVNDKHQEFLDQCNEYLKMYNVEFSNLIEIRHQLEIIEGPIENEFIMCKDFLENSAQGQLYDQAEKARIELNNAISQQIFSIKIGLESFSQYGRVMEFYPRSILHKHRFFWFEDWLKSLSESPSDCSVFLDKFYDTLNQDKIPNENSLSYAFELEKIWLEINFNLRKSYDLLQVENSISSNFDIAHNAIVEYLNNDPCGSPIKCLQTAIFCELKDIIGQLIPFEETCLKSITDPFHFPPNSNWIIDEQQIFLLPIKQITKDIFESTNTEYWTSINCIDKLLEAIMGFKTLEIFLIKDLTIKIVQLFMRENTKILLIFENIIQLQNAFDFEHLSKQLHEGKNCRREINLLNDAMVKIKFETKTESEILNNILELLDENFSNCCRDVKHLVASMTNISDNVNFVSMDHYRRAHALKENLQSSNEVIQQRFELKKYQILIQLLLIATKLSTSLKFNDVQCAYDINIFIQAISNLINDLQINFTLGLGSYFATQIEIELLKLFEDPHPFSPATTASSEELSRLIIENNLNCGTYTLPSLTRAEGAVRNFILAAKKRKKIENLTINIASQTECLKHMQLIATVHFWINEKFLLQQPPFGHILHKNIILQNLQSSLQNARGWQITIDKILNEISDFSKDISQRLKWGVGANPGLLNLQQAYEECSLRNNDELSKVKSISVKMSNFYNLIIAYELLKMTAQDSDDQFVILVQQLRKSWEEQNMVNSIISKVELGIVELLDPEGSVDRQWISSISDLINEITDGVHNNLAQLEKDIYNVQENLQLFAHKLQSFDSELRVDVRYLLKLVFRLDGGHQRQKQFQANYKQFLTRISDVHMKILSKDFTQENLQEIRELISDLHLELSEIYGELLNLVTGQDENIYVRRDETPRKKNQVEQKRNAYAVSVWRRIRMKLEGRDPDPNRRQTISEQVDWMIREATSPDNLAVLYEGWTPWV